MNIQTEEQATTLANQLKELIRRFEHRSFTAHIGHMGNVHIRQGSEQVKLRSPVRQILYLMSLYHATALGGKERYTATSKEHSEIIRLLNEIEEGYGYEAAVAGRSDLTQADYDRLIVTKGTFLNYYLNAPLSYYEQDVERIQRTFEHFEPYITEQTGLQIKDYLDFFTLMSNLESARVSQYINHNYDNNPILESIRAGTDPKDLSIDQKIQLMELAENAVYDMGIPLSDIYQAIGEEKAKQLLAFFTLLREEAPEYLYYTDPCAYLRKPVIMMDGHHVLMVYSKQLINAIYEFLYALCSEPGTPGRKVSERRDEYLEHKTADVFRDFFGPAATIYTSYKINTSEKEGNEKDLLVLHGSNAYIIECKAHKYREPMRDESKAYERIKDDFRKSIGKGYSQAKEVEDLLIGDQPFQLYNKKKQVIATLQPEDYDEVFTIVVTQERFGQIQCDLGYLLDIGEDSNYPWSVAINDLETFLITLKRKARYAEEFETFLLARERLQGRVMCYDELELCAYFLFDRENFVKNCNRSELLFSSPDMNKFFDLLYNVGFGFRDEINLAEKLKRRDFHAAPVIKYHKLKPAERVIEFQKQRSTGK